MATITHEFAWPDRVVIGTIGRPGSRSFYLQVRDGRRLVSVGLEKQQSAVLAEKIEDVLAELAKVEQNRFSVPESTPLELIDNEPLEQPVDEQFRAGAMTLGWDPTTAQIVIEAFPLSEIDADALESGLEEGVEFEPEEVLRVSIPVGTARAFADRTREIVGAGRPLCPLCGEPLDADDHVCGRLGDGP